MKFLPLKNILVASKQTIMAKFRSVIRNAVASSVCCEFVIASDADSDDYGRLGFGARTGCVLFGSGNTGRDTIEFASGCDSTTRLEANRNAQGGEISLAVGKSPAKIENEALDATLVGFDRGAGRDQTTIYTCQHRKTAFRRGDWNSVAAPKSTENSSTTRSPRRLNFRAAIGVSLTRLRSKLNEESSLLIRMPCYVECL